MGRFKSVDRFGSWLCQLAWHGLNSSDQSYLEQNSNGVWNSQWNVWKPDEEDCCITVLRQFLSLKIIPCNKKLIFFCHIFSSWRIRSFIWYKCICLIFDFGNRSVWYQMKFWKLVFFLIGFRGNGSFGCFHWKVVVGVLICLSLADRRSRIFHRSGICLNRPFLLTETIQTKAIN